MPGRSFPLLFTSSVGLFGCHLRSGGARSLMLHSRVSTVRDKGITGNLHQLVHHERAILGGCVWSFGLWLLNPGVSRFCCRAPLSSLAVSFGPIAWPFFVSAVILAARGLVIFRVWLVAAALGLIADHAGFHVG